MLKVCNDNNLYFSSLVFFFLQKLHFSDEAKLRTDYRETFLVLVYFLLSITKRIESKEVLQPTLLSYLDGHPHTRFQQDNARLHYSHQAIHFLQEGGVSVM